MNIIGMPSIHNPTWTLIRNGQIVVSIEEDRLNRQKNRFGFTNKVGDVDIMQGWHYCLKTAGILPSEIDYLAFGFNPGSIHQFNHTDYRMESFNQERIFRQQSLLLDYIRRKEGCTAPAYYIRHHLAHASAVYYCSPYDSAAIITIDGWGEDETVSICKAEGSSIKTIAVVSLPNSLGEVYTQLTKTLGWCEDDAGKTMGLAAYGSFNSSTERLISCGRPEDDKLWFDTSKALSLINSFPVRTTNIDINQKLIDLAARIQFEVEESLVYIGKWAFHHTRCRNLCLSGGVALNSVANYRVLMESGFENVFLQPACGDSGIPLGAALGLHFYLLPESTRFPISHPYFGRHYSEEEIRLSIGGLPFEFFTNEQILVRRTAELLSQQKIVAWFQGGSELGPRALGHRSILADPRRNAMKDLLNSRVKHREPFRPFAPSVLQESANEFFDIKVPSPYMLFVSPIKSSRLDDLQAVAHVDGTARLQTVTLDMNGIFYDLIAQFGNLTGIPIVLNTSFNTAGEPIVETPNDAVKCFIATKIDYLVMGQFIVSKAIT